MSVKIAASLTAAALGLGTLIYFQSARHSDYRPPVSRNYPQSQFSSKGVVNRIIQVRLTHDEAANNAEKITVKAELTMPFDFNERLYYRWKLGENVTLVSGELTGELPALVKGTTVAASIEVLGFSRETNHHIAFEIFGHQNGRTISGDSLIASDPENTFENTVQNVERIKASQ